jgi:homocysteine S-methyltransferase
MKILELYAPNAPVLLLDGGLATELEKDERVNLSSSCLWSASLLLDRNKHLEQVVIDAHTSYYLAGSNIATSDSYQASFEGFAKEGINNHEEAIQLFKKSISITNTARQNAQDQLQTKANPHGPLLVAASIGCYGAALADGSEYLGIYDKEIQDLVAWHRERFQVLAYCDGVDVVLFETVPCLNEVRAILLLLQENPTIKALISVACRNGKELNSGEEIAELTSIIAAIDTNQVLAVGVNCTAPVYVESLLQSYECPHGCAKLVYPNSGEKWDGVNKKWFSQDPQAKIWKDYLPAWYAVGARVFGGCCRTTPQDIEEIRSFFNNCFTMN